jgi:hypothetical protein
MFIAVRQFQTQAAILNEQAIELYAMFHDKVLPYLTMHVLCVAQASFAYNQFYVSSEMYKMCHLMTTQNSRV